MKKIITMLMFSLVFSFAYTQDVVPSDIYNQVALTTDTVQTFTIEEVANSVFRL